MPFPSLHRTLARPCYRGPESTSALAFLNDPFRTNISTLLFFATVTFATALIFNLLRYHYRRSQDYCGACAKCEQIRKESEAAQGQDGRKEFTGHVDYDGLESGRSGSTGTPGAAIGDDMRTDDLLGFGRDSTNFPGFDSNDSSIFYTPRTRSAMSEPCSSHRGQHNDLSHDSVNIPRRLQSRSADLRLGQARGEQAERARRMHHWPVALQKVVVGDVQEGVIAKRRRLTLEKGA
jgi:hypothetical protein